MMDKLLTHTIFALALLACMICLFACLLFWRHTGQNSNGWLCYFRWPVLLLGIFYGSVPSLMILSMWSRYYKTGRVL
ncbi:MAG: hypothetical protein SFV32_12505 [Opitutaceae bacterium]|nr:hypothetical protein [Opitutaceae bacterium]